jgi:hypothetical protein
VYDHRQPGVTGVLVHQAVDREIHRHRLLVEETADILARHQPLSMSRKTCLIGKLVSDWRSLAETMRIDQNPAGLVPAIRRIGPDIPEPSDSGESDPTIG